MIYIPIFPYLLSEGGDYALYLFSSYLKLQEAQKWNPIEYPKPDGVISFDVPTSLYRYPLSLSLSVILYQSCLNSAMTWFPISIFNFFQEQYKSWPRPTSSPSPEGPKNSWTCKLARIRCTWIKILPSSCVWVSTLNNKIIQSDPFYLQSSLMILARIIGTPQMKMAVRSYRSMLKTACIARYSRY